MKSSDIIETVGTYVIVGAASLVGAALWTYVLQGKYRMCKARLTQPKSEKIIDFAKAKKRLGR